MAAVPNPVLRPLPLRLPRLCVSLGGSDVAEMVRQAEALARDFKVCKVNVDTNQRLAAHYGISSIPVLLIFKGGQIVARHVGVTAEAVLRAELQEASPK